VDLAQLAYETERSNMDRRQALVAGLAKLRDLHTKPLSKPARSRSRESIVVLRAGVTEDASRACREKTQRGIFCSCARTRRRLRRHELSQKTCAFRPSIRFPI